MREHPIKLQVRKGVSLKDVIKGVEDLLSYYKSSDSRRFDGLCCPLCRLFHCEICLWYIFHRMSCDDYAQKRFAAYAGELKKKEAVEDRPIKEWRAFRVKELTYWLEELERPGVKVVELF